MNHNQQNHLLCKHGHLGGSLLLCLANRRGKKENDSFLSSLCCTWMDQKSCNIQENCQCLCSGTKSPHYKSVYLTILMEGILFLVVISSQSVLINMNFALVFYTSLAFTYTSLAVEDLTHKLDHF